MTEPGLMRLAKAAIFVLLFAAGVAGFFLGNPMQKLRSSQDDACHARCADLHKLHRLVPASPPGAVASGKYDGPWKCECYSSAI